MRLRKGVALCLIIGIGSVFGWRSGVLDSAIYDIMNKASVAVEGQDGHDESIDLYSQNAILLNSEGKTLLTKNAEERIAPASLTKIMTVHVALQHLSNLQQTIEMPSTIYPYLERENASMAGFLPHEIVTVEDLLNGALLSSGAEACVTLAIMTSGSEEAFVQLMNQEAERLGMRNTHFMNCTGLDQEGHYSSVEDIALLLRASLQNTTFANIFHNGFYKMVTNLHPDGLSLTSTMHQTMDAQGITSPYLKGGKTGYTQAAGLCLASQGEVDGNSYILVTARANGDNESSPYHIMDAIRVYEQLAD